MSALAERTKVTINLAGTHSVPCAEFAFPLYKQLANGKYDECAVQPIRFVEDWRSENRTARKRAGRATRLGYEFTEIARHEHADALYAINTSARVRQGRRMSEGYQAMPSRAPDPEWPCPLHGVHPYGVFDAHGDLVAYLWCYRSGELALVSQILGHADHLANDVMYLLFQNAMEREHAIGEGWWVYNRWDSGTEGLVYSKQKLGFRPMEVAWEL